MDIQVTFGWFADVMFVAFFFRSSKASNDSFLPETLPQKVSWNFGVYPLVN